MHSYSCLRSITEYAADNWSALAERAFQICAVVHTDGTSVMTYRADSRPPVAGRQLPDHSKREKGVGSTSAAWSLVGRKTLFTFATCRSNQIGLGNS